MLFLTADMIKTAEAETQKSVSTSQSNRLSLARKQSIFLPNDIIVNDYTRFLKRIDCKSMICSRNRIKTRDFD